MPHRVPINDQRASSLPELSLADRERRGSSLELSSASTAAVQRWQVARPTPSIILGQNHPIVQLRRYNDSHHQSTTLSLFKLHNHHYEAVVKDAADVKSAKFEAPSSAARKLFSEQLTDMPTLAGYIHLLSPDLGDIKLEVRLESVDRVLIVWRMGKVDATWRWQRTRLSKKRAVSAADILSLSDQLQDGSHKHHSGLVFAIEADVQWSLTFSAGSQRKTADLPVAARFDAMSLVVHDLMRDGTGEDKPELDAALFGKIIQLGALWLASHPVESLLSRTKSI